MRTLAHYLALTDRTPDELTCGACGDTAAGCTCAAVRSTDDQGSDVSQPEDA